MTPTVRQITLWFETLRKLTPKELDRLEKLVIRTVDRDLTAVPSADGHKRSTVGGGRGGAELTPVEAAAEERVFGRGTPDEHHQHASLVCGHLSKAAGSVASLRHALDHGSTEVPKKPVGHQADPTCTEPTCEEPAVEQGRCHRCAIWRTGWRAAHNGDVPPPVPEQVIADRNPGRVHVNPVTGEVA